MPHLEKEYGYKESHFEYIQQSIRKICIKYGAGLIYTSARKDVNCKLCMGYIKNRMYGSYVTMTPQLYDKDSIFIPAGADSMNKIRADFAENQSLTRDFDAPFHDVIPVPKSVQNHEHSAVDTPSVAEDDQEFLVKHREILDKDDVKDREKNKSGFLASLQKIGGATTEVVAQSNATVTAPVKSVAAPSVERTTVGRPVNTTLSTQLSADGKGESEVLANFFNSLIQKDARPPVKSSAPALSREDIAKHMQKLREKKQ